MKNLLKLAAIAVPVAMELGCTMSGMSMVVPSTSFVFPNSNVVPLGPVSSTKNYGCGFLIFTSGPTNRMVQEQIDAALAKMDGDVLINVQVQTSQTNYMLFSQCKVSVSGIAATMEVGQFEFKQ
jgi:hypothetical protein